MDHDKQSAMLKRLQEMEFVAIELNLYLDTHPCDSDALNDYNCAVEMVKKLMAEYEACFGPLLPFGMAATKDDRWQWADGPWPWEM